MVKNVTENWSALQHWTKEELMKRYPDMVVGMGNSKELGQGGGLRRTTISDYILNWMHSTSKYVFHTLGMPEVENFLADCTHLPMPTRMYYEDVRQLLSPVSLRIRCGRITWQLPLDMIRRD